MTLEEIEGVVGECQFPEYTFQVRRGDRGAWYLRAYYVEPDVRTHAPEMQFTRRWFLDPEQTKSEIIQTVFKCVLTSMEHRTREFFWYRGRNIFGPHFDCDRLWELCGSEAGHEAREYPEGVPLRPPPGTEG